MSSRATRRHPFGKAHVTPDAAGGCPSGKAHVTLGAAGRHLSDEVRVTFEAARQAPFWMRRLPSGPGHTSIEPGDAWPALGLGLGVARCLTARCERGLAQVGRVREARCAKGPFGLASGADTARPMATTRPGKPPLQGPVAGGNDRDDGDVSRPRRSARRPRRALRGNRRASRSRPLLQRSPKGARSSRGPLPGSPARPCDRPHAPLPR